MPLYKTINISPTTQILVWKITESFDELRSQVNLKPKTENRLNGMKSEMHQRAFLSVRMLLKEAGYTDFDLHYDELGKPYFLDGKYVSITHSHHFSAIIVSAETVGIDIEMQREKIIRIADKFVDYEFCFLETEKTREYIRKLTVIWGIKESIFKIRNEKGISFKDHVKVAAFEMDENQGVAWLHFDNVVEDFNIYFEEIENFTLVYAFEN